MVKLFTHTQEIEHCAECCESDFRGRTDFCFETDKTIENIWGKIPSWCPLETKPDTDDKPPA